MISFITQQIFSVLVSLGLKNKYILGHTLTCHVLLGPHVEIWPPIVLFIPVADLSFVSLCVVDKDFWVALTALELKDFNATSSTVLGLKVCATMAMSFYFLSFFLSFILSLFVLLVECSA